MVLTAFQSGTLYKLEESQKGKGVNASEGLKILTRNQMLKRLPIALAQKQVIIQKVY